MRGDNILVIDEATRRAALLFLLDLAAALKPASCDTQPKAGDVKQAPLVSGAVGKAETPKA